MGAIVFLVFVAALFIVPGLAVWIVAGFVLIVIISYCLSKGGDKQEHYSKPHASLSANLQNDSELTPLFQSSSVDDLLLIDDKEANYYDEDVGIRIRFEHHGDIPYEQHRLNVKQYREFSDRWQPIADEHNRLTREIGVAYTVANNLHLPDSPEMQHVIDLCIKDISLAPAYKTYVVEKSSLLLKIGWIEEWQVSTNLPVYPSFKRLAIIYDKRKDFDNAIAVCQQAIDLGFVSDGTDGQMYGRLARLIRKKNSTAKKAAPVDTVESTCSDQTPPTAE